MQTVSHFFQWFRSTLNVNPKYSERPRTVLLTFSGICILCVGIRHGAIIFYRKYNKIPPGLCGIPFFGSLITKIAYGNNFENKLLPSYGPLVSYTFGTNMDNIVVNNQNLAKKILDKICDRPEFTNIAKRNKNDDSTEIDHEGDVSTINNDNDWFDRRKILMSSVVKILDQRSLEQRILDVLHRITFAKLDKMIQNVHNAFDGKNAKNDEDGGLLWYPRNDVRNCAFNVMYGAICGVNNLVGYDCDYDTRIQANDERFAEYNKLFEIHFGNILLCLLMTSLPNLIKNCLGLIGFDVNVKTMNNLVTMDKLFEPQYNEMKTKLLQKNIDANDYQKSRSNIKGDTVFELMYYEFDSLYKGDDRKRDQRLLADLVGLIGAGPSTTGHTLEVAVLLLAKNPKIQQLIVEELLQYSTDVAGKDTDNDTDTIATEESLCNYKCISLSNINKCPYFRAFIHETLRIATPSPLGFPKTSKNKDLRCVKIQKSKDWIVDFVDSKKWTVFDKKYRTKFKDIQHDYIIPKGYAIWTNMIYINIFDKHQWGNNPMKLNLNNWLQPNDSNSSCKGTQQRKVVFVKNKASIPFNVGIRDCGGRSLGIKQVSTVIANLVVNYQILPTTNDANCINIGYNQQVVSVVTPETPVLVKKRY